MLRVPSYSWPINGTAAQITGGGHNRYRHNIIFDPTTVTRNAASTDRRAEYNTGRARSEPGQLGIHVRRVDKPTEPHHNTYYGHLPRR